MTTAAEREAERREVRDSAREVMNGHLVALRGVHALDVLLLALSVGMLFVSEFGTDGTGNVAPDAAQNLRYGALGGLVLSTALALVGRWYYGAYFKPSVSALDDANWHYHDEIASNAGLESPPR